MLPEDTTSVQHFHLGMPTTISRSTVLWRNIDVWRSFLQIAVHKYKGSSLKILYTIMIDNGGALRGMGVDGHEWEKMGIVVDMDKHST